MLEYWAYKRHKQHKEEKSARLNAESVKDAEHVHGEVVINEGVHNQGNGKLRLEESDAIDSQDEQFLESNLGSTTVEAPMTLKRVIASLAIQWSALKLGKLSSSESKSSKVEARSTLDKKSAEEDALDTSARSSLVDRSHQDEGDEALSESDDPLAPLTEESQRTQLERLLTAFNMNIAPAKDPTTTTPTKTMAQRMNETFKVSTFNDKTKALMSEFLQILKDIQSGVPLAGKDLQNFFEKHATDLKTANESVPSFVKTLVLKLLPFSALPSIEELSRPGAIMALIKTVLQVLKTRFPAFVGGSVLMVMAVVIVMLGLFYAFKRGRDDREGPEDPPFSGVSDPGVAGLDRPGRQVEISVDGVRYVTILDEDGMRVPVPEDQRGVYWERQNLTALEK